MALVHSLLVKNLALFTPLIQTMTEKSYGRPALAKVEFMVEFSGVPPLTNPMCMSPSQTQPRFRYLLAWEPKPTLITAAEFLR